ncbi:hypothetical protein [Pseudomarimonas salicorniae]|uniref:Uncharacterized protein n=1 Tax=Pseudomarimonas salicorniae TaxID=2933270 RepID=A0ABT0GHW6_9GAMM|nr:hypothetical protein [Lysobacter sp. CAU 1642]MCK7594146.1 hypothetical protein [Lysobacter sp. CAU 1642]
MATRKTPAKKAVKKAASKKAATKPAAKRTPRKRATAKTASAGKAPAKARRLRADDAPDAPEQIPARIPPRRVLTETERERRFNILLQATCLKAGTAAAIATITRRVPFLGRLAPVILGSVGEGVALSRIQQQLVRDIIQLYDVELSDLEERGVILLATAANVGAKELSKATVNQLVKQLSGVLYRPILARVLPLAAITTDIAAAVASTYAVGKRAKALCKLPGTGARDLSDLLRGLSGIDQSRLFKWSAEALGLALKPFRGALTALIPGLR